MRVVGEIEVSRDTRVALLQSPDRLIDLVGLDESSVCDAPRQAVYIGTQAAFLFGADCAILGDALFAAAQHIGLFAITTGLDLDHGLLLTRIARRRLAQHRGKSVGVFEVGEPAVALGLPAGDDVVKLALFDLDDVVVERHAAIDHHGRAFLKAGARGQQIEHGGKRGAILGVAGEHLVGDRKAVAIDHQGDHHLLTIRPVIARVAALGLGIALTLAFEIGRGEIVEIDRGVEIEQAALAFDERSLDGRTMLMEFVEHLVKRVFCNGVEIGVEKIAERGAPQPGRHCVFGGRRDQAIEHHRTGEPSRGCRQAAAAQDTVEFEALPELIADVDRTGLAMALGCDPRRIDLDQDAAGAASPR